MAARKDLAASLADMGAIPPSYLAAMRGTERNGDALPPSSLQYCFTHPSAPQEKTLSVMIQ